MDGFRQNISRFTLYKEYPDCSLENSLEGEQAWKLRDQIILAVVWEMFNAFFFFISVNVLQYLSVQQNDSFFLCGLYSIIDYYKILNIIPCAIQ